MEERGVFNSGRAGKGATGVRGGGSYMEHRKHHVLENLAGSWGCHLHNSKHTLVAACCQRAGKALLCILNL